MRHHERLSSRPWDVRRAPRLSGLPRPGPGPLCCRASRPPGKRPGQAVPVTFCNGRTWKKDLNFLLPR